MIKRTDDEMNIEDAMRHNEEIERREAQEEAHNPRKRNAPDEPPKRCVNFLWIDEGAWNILVGAANSLGCSLSNLCADLLIDAANNMDDVLASRSFKLNRLRNRAKEYFDHLSAVEMIAIECNLRPSNELSEMLVSMCDELGIDPEGLKEKIKGDPMAEEIASFRANPKTKTAQCKQWIVNLMRQHDYRIAAQKANQIGMASGFTKDMMAQVRRKLNVQSIPDITGVHYWTVNKSANAAMTILKGGIDEWNSGDY